MRVALIWVGREHRKSPEQAICERYFSRLSSFVKWEEKVVKGVSGGMDMHEVQRRESDRLAQCLQPQDYVILLDSRGKPCSSEGLAAQITQLERRSIKRVVFLIGGAMGVNAAMRERANSMLSLSQMTLPHALARVLLLEQLYRAWCIKTGHPYHHEG